MGEGVCTAIPAQQPAQGSERSTADVTVLVQEILILLGTFFLCFCLFLKNQLLKNGYNIAIKGEIMFN